MSRYRLTTTMLTVPLVLGAITAVVAQSKPQSDTPLAEILYVRTEDGKFVPRVATILNTTAQTVVVNVGVREGFKVGDKVVFGHRTKAGLLLKGTGIVTRTYASDCECDLPKNVEAANMKPGDEVYVTGREDTRYSLTKAEFKAAGE